MNCEINRLVDARIAYEALHTALAHVDLVPIRVGQHIGCGMHKAEDSRHQQSRFRLCHVLCSAPLLIPVFMIGRVLHRSLILHDHLYAARALYRAPLNAYRLEPWQG